VDIAPPVRFESLYRAYFVPVSGYVVRRVANPEDAADILAATFLTLWRRLDEAPPDDQIRPWLYGVARRVLANHHRGVRRQTALAERLAGELKALYPQGVVPDGEDEVHDELAVAFELLSPQDRELLSLVAWEGLSHDEIAGALGLSRALVRVRLHRARRRLTALLSLPGPVQRTVADGHVVLRGASARPGTPEATS
jgi:RNA polymerase sigma-70 factor, ECF subfamily